MYRCFCLLLLSICSLNAEETSSEDNMGIPQKSEIFRPRQKEANRKDANGYTGKSKPHSMSEYFTGHGKNEKLESMRFLPELGKQSHSHGYGVQPKKKKESSESVSRDTGDAKQVVAGIPDTSDPCFRRYENCIVINAQPYERRSSTSLIKCKLHCLHSQTGVYSCRSFVYDNVNQVCDLFAHVGDQSPARLLKFQTRDYFEPTSAVQCLHVNEPNTTPDVVAHASNIDERKEEFNKVKVEETLVEQKTTHDEEIETPCPNGKKTGFLRTEGFELFNNDDVIIDVDDVSECTEYCQKNTVSGKHLDCKSFDYSAGKCSFSKEAAVPVGEGQLKQKKESFYYEKICVKEQTALDCAAAFNRSPQMILVGFAESVSDSATFEHCFDSCLNSFQLFGFNCTSGMYYFEESSLNCILNSENRYTQPDLFAEENTDIVDYFEVNCEKRTKSRPRISGVKTFTEQEGIKSEKLVIAEETHTAWSDCMDGLQHRRRDCKDRANCGMESRQCVNERDAEKGLAKKSANQDMPTKEEISALKAKLAKEGFNCAKDECCKVFVSCAVGLRQNSGNGQLEWCKRPCETKRSRQSRRFMM